MLNELCIAFRTVMLLLFGSQKKKTNTVRLELHNKNSFLKMNILCVMYIEIRFLYCVKGTSKAKIYQKSGMRLSDIVESI